ncbi:MAG: transposase [Gammaproteobacteria bacterium]
MPRGTRLEKLTCQYRQGVSNVRRRLPEILEDGDKELSMPGRELIAQLYEKLCALGERLEAFEERLKSQFRDNPVCQRLAKIGGISAVTATAIVAWVGNASVFDGGRGLAPWMGLVPRQYSTGGKTRLGSISRRGDRYLRTLLIHGARSVIRHPGDKQDTRSCWLRQLVARRGKNVASVALTNKNARTIWAIMAREEDYRVA